ncbi:MAG: ABC transporter ATP-binding protein [Flavobacteriales bacterium]
MTFIKKNIIQKLIHYPLQYKGLFIATILIALSNSYASAYRPKLISEVIDVVIPNKNLELLLQSIYLIVGIIIIEAVLQFIFIILANTFAQNIIQDIRNDLFKKLIYFKLDFFNNTPNGVLVTRAVSDIETISTVFSDGLIMIFGDILKISFIILMMYTINWKMATIILLIIPIMIFLTRYFQKSIKKTFQDERSLAAKLNSFVQERITGIKIIQIFNREKAEFKKFQKINTELKQAHIRTVFYFAVFFPITEIISSIAIGLVILYGGYATYNDLPINAGEIIAFILYIQMLFRPMRQVADRFNNMQRGLVGAERVLKLMDSHEVIPNHGITQLNQMNGNIEFKDVHFSYKKGEEVLKGISFQVKAGETIAIVGATGAGKSTIVNLLTRFYDIDSGKIEIDAIDIKDIPLETLRTKIAVVLQDVFLFNDTIFQNITLGNNAISKEHVINAAKKIKLHQFIQNLPNEYDYEVKERGATLSVGQRQLISFLRAMVYNPDILVLDEATSSIDNHSEHLIQEATQKVTQNRTSIVIAHRLATIQNADKIIALENGTIKEIGTHQELLQNPNSYYKRLYDAQFSTYSNL